MNTRRIRLPRRALCALLTLLATATAPGAPEIDLVRDTPVPADQQIPVADFFRQPILRGPELNPGGTHFAAIASVETDKTVLVVYDLEKEKLRAVGGDRDRDISTYRWLDDSRLIFNIVKDKSRGEGAMVLNLPSLESHALLQWIGAVLVGVPEASPRRPLFWIRGSKYDESVAVINTDIDTGGIIAPSAMDWGANYGVVMSNNEKHIRDLIPAPKGGLVTGFLCDKDGELAFGFTAKDGLGTLHRYVNKKWEKCPVDLEKIDVLIAGEKPGELVVRAPREAGKPRAVRFLDASTSAFGEVLLEDDGYDFTGTFYRHPVTKQIIGVSYHRHVPRTVWFTEAYRSIQKVLDGFFPGKQVRIVGSDRIERRFVVAVSSDRQPHIFLSVDLETRALKPIKSSLPWIDPERMRPMGVLKFKTADGRSLDAYLTLPEGATKEKPAPLVVLPHGGPWVRDTWGFDREVQFLASRGYAVLQPNYRGSPGYEWLFPEEDEWAFRKMHDDVTAATRAAIATGRVDPKRIAIGGGSFGAYLALSGVAHEPDLYRCAVTIAGVFDWERVVKSAKDSRYYNSQYDRLLRKLGDPKKEKAKFEEISPLRHVGSVRVPVFVAHGKEDYIAEVQESYRLIAELKKHKIPHEAFIVSEEGHGMARVENQVALYSRVEAFLATHLAPTAPAIAAAPAP